MGGFSWTALSAGVPLLDAKPPRVRRRVSSRQERRDECPVPSKGIASEQNFRPIEEESVMPVSPPLTPGALKGVRVLDLSDESCVYGAKVLADLGADVVRVEPAGGDPMR